MPGIASAVYWMLIASLALWGVVAIRGRQGVGISSKKSWKMFCLASLGGVFFAADVGLYNVAVLQTKAGSATFLGNNAALMVGLLTWGLLGKPPARRFWVALGVALAGSGLIVAVDWNRHVTALKGDAIAALASICFALYMVTTERLRRDADTAILATVSTTASAITLLVAAAISHTSLVVPTESAFFAVLGLGVVCQFAGYFGLTYALGHVPATVSSVVLLGVAPLTAILAYLLFYEAMQPVQLWGGALILTAVWIVSQNPGKEEVYSQRP